MSAAGSIIVVDDRLGSAALVSTWLQGCGRAIAVSATYAEAAATISYHQLAGTGVPALVIGPLQREAVAFLADLRDQKLSIPAACYTEAKSRDQDAALARQYGLIAILHKPFAGDDRAQLESVLGGDGAEQPELPVGASPALPVGRMGDPPRATAEHVPSLDEILGTGRSSSVGGSKPSAPRKDLSAAELPSGVQRLLVDPMSATVDPSAAKAKAKEKEAASEPRKRAIAAIVVDDVNGSARLLVERLVMPGQTMKPVATWAEALEQIQRQMSGNLGCELLLGPLTADGVHMVKELRKRSLPTHVIFYTESSTQSQDPRLREQYGCLAIVRRSGMVEPLERLIDEVRSAPKREPQPPVDPPPLSRAPPARTAPSSPAASMPAGSLGAQRHPSGVFAPEAAPTASSSGRMRRSLSGQPAVTSPAAPADNQAPLQIDVPGDDAPVGQDRVVTCRKCAHEFVASVDHVPCTVTCAKCGAVNPISAR
jgi:CheY-like chemotaxis protein